MPVSAEPRTASPRIALSDVHGHLDALRGMLLELELTAPGDVWAGGDRQLWLLGDYLDRGPDGLEVVDMVRRLQSEARGVGGRIHPLLGNHELQFLAALHFGHRTVPHQPDTTWMSGWLRFGGVEEELRAVSDEQVEWMTELPLIDAVDGVVLAHSDSEGYLELGQTVEEINAVGRDILAGRDQTRWALLHELMTRKGDFLTSAAVDRFVGTLGAQRVIHGHSTLGGVFHLGPEDRTRPHVYADGRVTAIDGGVFEGGVLIPVAW
ncbi:MAG: metallophosphoesterase [Nocardioides sp.]